MNVDFLEDEDEVPNTGSVCRSMSLSLCGPLKGHQTSRESLCKESCPLCLRPLQNTSTTLGKKWEVL